MAKNRRMWSPGYGNIEFAIHMNVGTNVCNADDDCFQVLDIF
jgi:hypothetical protein